MQILVAVTFMLSSVRICLTTGWIIPVYDVRSQQRFAFAEDFLRIVLQEQSEAVGGRFLEYASAPLDKEGYIINEDGQLVPFKIYKKGGARMCFLHPRNCRGGFHKRLTEGPNEQETEDIYDLHVNKRNQKTNRNVDETVRAKQRFDYDDNDIFDPGFNSEEIEKDVTSFTPAELRLLKEYNNKFLSEFPETVQSETERRAPNSRFHKTLSFASKQSRNSNDIRDPFVLKEDLLPKDLDFRYSQSWPEYSSDSSLSLDLPTGIKHREPYSYLSDDIPGVDGPKHGNRKFLTGYDVTAYHKFNHKGSR